MHATRFFWIGIAALQGFAAVRGGDSLPLVFVPNRGQAHARRAIPGEGGAAERVFQPPRSALSDGRRPRCGSNLSARRGRGGSKLPDSRPEPRISWWVLKRRGGRACHSSTEWHTATCTTAST